MHKTDSCEDYYWVLILYTLRPSLDLIVLFGWVLTFVRSQCRLWSCIHCGVYKNEDEVGEDYDGDVGYFNIFIACEPPACALAGISVKATDFAKH